MKAFIILALTIFSLNTMCKNTSETNELKKELIHLNDELIKQQLMKNNSPESFRTLFAQVKTLELANSLTDFKYNFYAGNMDEFCSDKNCNFYTKNTLLIEYQTKMEEIGPKMSELDNFSGERRKYMLKELQKIPLKNFEGMNNHFFILHQTYLLGRQTRGYEFSNIDYREKTESDID